MAMSLSDIEERAQDLIVQLLSAGKQEALLLGIQIEGLRDLAQIKAVGDQRAQWNASVGMREEDSIRRDREISAMEVVAAKVPEPVSAGQCFVPAPLMEHATIYPFCELQNGHSGAHKGSGMTWSGDYVPPAPCSSSAPCPSTLSMDKDEYYVCTIPAPHEGPHSGGGKWWTGLGNGKQEAEVAEPTKPAADQLHELLSYLRTHAEEADDKAGHVSAQSPPWTRHKAVYRAYDDAATKLRDILSEGGI